VGLTTRQPAAGSASAPDGAGQRSA